MAAIMYPALCPRTASQARPSVTVRSFHVPQLAHALDEGFGERIVIRGRRA
jgi:hypothetical protein